MSSFGSLSPDKLARMIGTHRCPVIVDVRIDAHVAANPKLIPGSIRRVAIEASGWAHEFKGRSVVVQCEHGLKLSHGAAAWLRHEGADAIVLEGGFVAWAEAKLPLVPIDRLPDRDNQGRTVWVTRARPKVDRIACPWLIRRFIDPDAVFLFVAPAEVALVADRFKAVAFDIENTHWSHRGERCTFDVMVEEFGLSTPALERLALIVRAADTGQMNLVPEAAGLLAASLGLSRMHGDDLEQLAAGIALFDAFYRWCRDATDETHNWPAVKPKVRS